VASPRRQPGSDLGRPLIDWEQAFAFFASLAPERRSYAAVAAEFGVSVRTVERHGRSEQWQQRLRLINTQAAAETDNMLGHARADQIGKLVKLIDASLVAYAERLRRGDVRIGPADLDRLYKLWQQLQHELAQPPEPQAADEQPAAPLRSPEHTAAVIEALRETGTLSALGMHTVDPNDSSNPITPITTSTEED
jgi:hypothetical protein